MINNEFITNKEINVKVVLKSNSNIDFLKDVFSYILTYINLKVSYISDFSVKKSDKLNINDNEKIDFYFVDFTKKFEYIFAWNFYSKLHNKNKNFKLVLIKEEIEKDDVKYFKNGADDIVYTSLKYYGSDDEREKYLRWKMFSILRRRWDDSHNELILIRNGVIIDLIKRKVIVNNKEIRVTNKEFEILSILIDEFYKKNNYTSKKKLFKKIYGFENNENSRVLDQFVFRLKNKFGENFFDINKQKGIKIL